MDSNEHFNQKKEQKMKRAIERSAWRKLSCKQRREIRNEAQAMVGDGRKATWNDIKTVIANHKG